MKMNILMIRVVVAIKSSSFPCSPGFMAKPKTFLLPIMMPNTKTAMNPLALSV